MTPKCPPKCPVKQAIILAEGYQKLSKKGKNNVENIIDMMKKRKIIDPTPSSVNRARCCFNNTVANKNSVQYEELVAVLSEIETCQDMDSNETIRLPYRAVGPYQLGYKILKPHEIEQCRFSQVDDDDDESDESK